MLNESEKGKKIHPMFKLDLSTNFLFFLTDNQKNEENKTKKERIEQKPKKIDRI